MVAPMGYPHCECLGFIAQSYKKEARGPHRLLNGHKIVFVIFLHFGTFKICPCGIQIWGKNEINMNEFAKKETKHGLNYNCDTQI